METLLSLAVWGGLFFLMMRLGHGAHIMGHRQTQPHSKTAIDDTPELRWMAPKKDTDPVCGKTVATDKARMPIQLIQEFQGARHEHAAKTSKTERSYRRLRRFRYRANQR